MRMFFVADIQGSTPAFERFLTGLDAHDADVGVALGDLSGSAFVSLISLGSSRWRTAIDGKSLTLEGADELSAVQAELESRGHYWIEVSEEEHQSMRENPGIVELLFKSTIRKRMEKWIDIADERLARSRCQLFMTPGANDWAVIDDLLDGEHAVKPCDGRVVPLSGYDMITCSATGKADNAERSLPENVLSERLETLFASSRRAEYAIFNCRAYSRAADKIVKRRKPMLRIGSAGSSLRASVSHVGRTLVINPGIATAADGVAGIRGALVELEHGAVKNYTFVTA